MTERARSLGYRSAAVDFRWAASRAEFLARGTYQEAIEELGRCVRDPALRGVSAPFVAADLALALCDVGRDAEAQRWVLAGDVSTTAANVMVRGLYAGEIEWLSGRAAAAVPVLEGSLKMRPGNVKAESAAVLGWARLELGDAPDPPPARAGAALFRGGFELECEALHALG